MIERPLHQGVRKMRDRSSDKIQRTGLEGPTRVSCEMRYEAMSAEETFLCGQRRVNGVVERRVARLIRKKGKRKR